MKRKTGKRIILITTVVCLVFFLNACTTGDAETVQSTEAAITEETSTEEIVIIVEQEEPETVAEEAAAEETAEEKVSKETSTNETVPAESLVFDSRFYTYEEMKHELSGFAKQNNDIAALTSLGQTADGRELLCLRIGPEDADDSLIVTGAIHAREYITTELIMKQVRDISTAYENGAEYKGYSYPEIFSKCAVYILPMVNPDGVAISQFGLSGLNREEVRETVQKIAASEGGGSDSYYRKWKSNAEGIDLNRQFDALWEEYDDHVGHPSADHYKGTAPGTAVEAKALIELTEQLNPKRTLSYHTAGSVIYWYFGQAGELKDKTKAFADRISGLTGYPLDANYQSLDPAGYKDWAISKKGIPSLTVEVGSGSSPLERTQLDGIYEKNRHVIEEACISVIEDQ